MIDSVFDDEMQKALLRDMPSGTRMHMERSDDNQKTLVIKDKQESFSYEFSLGQNGYCKFDSASVNTRGTNLSAVLWRNVTEVLPEIGVRSIDVYANEIGTYLWNRAGFAPFPTEWARMVPQLQRRLDYLVSVNGDELQGTAEVMNRHLISDNPKTLWKIADCKDVLSDGSPLGKAMLLAWIPENFPDNPALTEKAPVQLQKCVAWRGKLDLLDSESDDRLYAYTETADALCAKAGSLKSVTGSVPHYQLG